MRGCSLMVKPQSSKLITRVRFPSSPPLQRLRRKRRGLLRSRDDGNRFRLKVPKAFETFRLQPVIPSRTILNESVGIPSACGFVSSRARDFRPSARHPLENYPERICRNPFRMRICFLARSESARSSLLIYTPQAPAAPRQSWRIHRATPQYCRGAPSPGKENHRHHQKEQRLRRHPQQESPENHNLPPSAQW